MTQTSSFTTESLTQATFWKKKTCQKLITAHILYLAQSYGVSLKLNKNLK
jgi:hypothetical protein